MPPRKPPKSLMCSCVDVISNSFLDITANIEDSVSVRLDSVANKNLNLVRDNTDGVTELEYELCRMHEEEVAKYMFARLPSALISLLLSQIMKEFAARWRAVIEISDNKLHFPNCFPGPSKSHV